MTSTPTFYIVEDDPTDYGHIQQAIQQIAPDLTVRRFFHGAALLAHLRQLPVAEYPSMIMLDYFMPILNGIQTLEQLKADEQLRRIPVLIWSGSSRPEDILEAYTLGALAFHTKPDEFDEWQAQLRISLRYWLTTTSLPDLTLHYD